MNQNLPNFDLWQKGYKLLIAIHRLVEVFPKERKFSIGSDLKHSANEVLTKIVTSKFNLANEKILETLSNLEVAKGLGLAKNINFQILGQEYQKLAKEVISTRLSLGIPRGLASWKVKISKKLTPRQKKIIQYLKENNKINFSQAREIFSEVSSRTLRLDLKSLLAQKLIHKNGKSVRTYYTLFT